MRRWVDPDPTAREPHDSQLIVMGAMIDLLRNGNGPRRFKDRAKRATIPALGGTGLGSLILIELVRLFGG